MADVESSTKIGILKFLAGSKLESRQIRTEIEELKAIAQKLGIKESNMVDCCSNTIRTDQLMCCCAPSTGYLHNTSQVASVQAINSDSTGLFVTANPNNGYRDWLRNPHNDEFDVWNFAKDYIQQKPKYPTKEQIRDAIMVYINSDPKDMTIKYKFRYSDGTISAEDIHELFNDRLVDYDKNDPSLIDMKSQFAEKVEKMYKNKFIEEEMKMNVNEYDSLERALRSIGGCVDLEYETIGSAYYRNDPEVTIKLPASMIKYMKVNMPTTDFDKNGCTANKIEANSVPKVSRVETYNDKVVKVTFSDGTFTKSVCSDNDTFNVDIGITICIMKRMMSKTEGNKKYNDMIRKIHEQMEKNEKEKEEKKAAQIKKKEDNRKANEKKAKKKAAQRAEQIDIQKTAFVEAVREINNITGDDSK